MLPILLILLGIISAGAVAFGCDPAVAEFAGSVGFITTMYRLQWLFIGLTVVSGLSLVALVVTSQRRAWWLIGLLPVMGMFIWRFGVSPSRPGAVDEQPTFIHASQSGWIRDEDDVIGVIADGQAIAIPIAAMHHVPVIVWTQRDRRLVVTWSARAGIASAFWVDRNVRGRDLRVVANPHGVLLLFNSRLGEFFDSLSLRQKNGALLTGFEARIGARVTTWEKWKQENPQTLALQPRWSLGEAKAAVHSAGPTVIYVATDPPIILPTDELSGEPANVSSGKSTALLFREGGVGRIIAMDRAVDSDLFPRFSLNLDRKLKNAALIDADTNSSWTWNGECIDGPLKGKRLRRLLAIENVPVEAARFWLK